MKRNQTQRAPLLRRAAAAALACLLLPLPAFALAEEDEPAHNGFLVAMEDGGDEDALERVTEGLYLTQDEDRARLLVETGRAEYMEPNYVVSLMDGDGEAPEESGEAEEAEAADGWQHEAVRRGNAEAFGLDGSGVRIAVIDSGVDLQNGDLQGAKLLEGYDYTLQTAEMTDKTYRRHGTKVTQMIAADRNALGCTGLARGAEIVPLRCFDASGHSSIDLLAAAIRDAVTKYECDIINMSWGLSGHSEALYDAISFAHRSGAILVAAAGNIDSGFPAGTLLYPAAYDEVVGVGSVGRSLRVSSFSQRTPAVTVCAPGEGLSFFLSASRTTTDQGTSFASPCAAAELALLLQLAPALTPELCASLLSQNCLDLGDAGYDDAYGYGFLRLSPSLLLSAWTLEHGDSDALLASYGGDGRMLSLAPLSRAAGPAEPRLLAFEEAAETCAVFFLDAACAPVSGAIRLQAG